MDSFRHDSGMELLKLAEKEREFNWNGFDSRPATDDLMLFLHSTLILQSLKMHLF